MMFGAFFKNSTHYMHNLISQALTNERHHILNTFPLITFQGENFKKTKSCGCHHKSLALKELKGNN